MTTSQAMWLPPWLLAPDLLAAASLAIGLVVVSSPGLLDAFAPDRALGWSLAVLGGAGILASSVAIVLLVRPRRAGR